MNKVLSIITVCTMLLSIVLSVSPIMKNKIISIVGNNNQAASLIPIPKLSVQDKKLAVQDNQGSNVKKTYKYSSENITIK